MKIEEHVTGDFLSVESERETNIDSFHSKAKTVLFVGFEHIGIVDESGRSDQHKGELFTNTLVRIFDHVHRGRIVWIFIC